MTQSAQPAARKPSQKQARELHAVVLELGRALSLAGTAVSETRERLSRVAAASGAAEARVVVLLAFRARRPCTTWRPTCWLMGAVARRDRLRVGGHAPLLRAARIPGGPPSQVTFLPAFWLLVPGALGLIGGVRPRPGGVGLPLDTGAPACPRTDRLATLDPMARERSMG